jgi:hypothetical protein
MESCLAETSADEQRFWTGFELVGDEAFIAESDDPRFRKWVDRYIMGDWAVEDGPIARLDTVAGQVNAIAECVVSGPLDHVAEQRRLASHKNRPQGQSFAAFEEFGKDIRAAIRAIEIIRDNLAGRLNVDVARCEERASAMRFLPTFDASRPTQPNYGIFKALRMEGKKVEKVRTGEVVSEPGVPETEALVIEFSDGSLMSIEAAANIAQIIRSG